MPRIMLALFMLPCLGISPAVVRASTNMLLSSPLSSETQSEVEELRERAMCGSTRRWRLPGCSDRARTKWFKLDRSAPALRHFACDILIGCGSETGHRLANGCLAPLRC